MNQKQAKRIRKLVRETSQPGYKNRSRYNALKEGWNKTPKDERAKLMEILEMASKNIQSSRSESS